MPPIPATRTHPDWPAELIGYQFVRELGRGGMSIVFEAIETELSRRVAVKVLPRSAALDERQVARFQQEAQTAAGLDHAHVLPVYSVACRDDVRFYVMKHVEGSSLAQVIGLLRQNAEGHADESSEPRIPVESRDEDTWPNRSSPSTLGDTPWPSYSSAEYYREVARLGIQAAEALHHVHACGFTHGDVKPSNLLVDVRRHLWLTDFGLARATSHTHETAAAAGTLRYLSPELARGEYAASDHRADIYALGATLFELATLRPAIPEASDTEILLRIAYGAAPSPAQFNASFPAGLRVILCRAMSANPCDRQESARELAEEMRHFLDGKHASTTASAAASRALRRWMPRRAILVIAVAVTLFVVLPLLALLPPMFFRGRPQATAAAPLRPSELALRRLIAMNATWLPELEDRLARGGKPTDEELSLLESGPPSLPVPEINKPWDSGSMRDGLAEFQYRAELIVARFRLARIHGRLGTWDRQAPMLRQAVELLERQVEIDPNGRFAELAIVSLAEAGVFAAAGRNEEARKLGRRAIALAESRRVADSDTGDPDVVAAHAHTQFGRMLLHVLPSAEVEQHLRQALKLLESRAQNPVSLRRSPFLPYESLDDIVAECRVNLAACLGPSDEGESLLESVLEYLDEPAESTDPLNATAEWRAALAARAEQVLGEILHLRGRHDEALPHLRRSIELVDRLQSEFPVGIEYPFVRATTNLLLGKTFAATGKRSEADGSFERAVQGFDGLVKSHPQVAAHHANLAASINNRVHDLPPSDAAAQLQLAVKHQMAALAINPDHRVYQRWASVQLSNLSLRLANLKDVRAAADTLGEAIKHRQAVIQLGSQKYDDRHAVGHYLLRLGLLLIDAERDVDAEREFREACELFRVLIDEFGRRACDLGSLGAVLNNLALILHERGEDAQALPLVEEAILVQEEALRLEPMNEAFLQYLENHRANLATLSAGQRERQSPSQGLVSWWKADESANDSAGANHGTLSNGTSYAPGQIGMAFSFDGVNGGVSISDSPNLAFSGSLTIEGWVKVGSFPNVPRKWGVIIMRTDDRLGLDPYSLTVHHDGTLNFAIGSLTAATTVAAEVTAGEFIHVAATLDDATDAMTLYLNGKPVAKSKTALRPWMALDPAYNPSVGIGNHGGFPATPHSMPFHGLIDELKVYDVPLTAEEVLAIYIAGRERVE